MKQQGIIAGLDIGSTNVRLVLGQMVATDNATRLQVVGAVSAPTEGVSKGVITSIEEATSAVSACLEKAERLLGVAVSNVWLGINGPNLKCEKSKGVVAVSRGNNEINTEDVKRVLEAAQALSVPQHYEILHVVPVEYRVDNQESVKDPIGMAGIRLEAEALIIQAVGSQIKNLSKVAERAGLRIEDFVFSPMAASAIVLDNKQRELGVALVNLGAATTSLAIFEEGELLHTAVLPIGAAHITADVAIGLRCPINLAEKVKTHYGSAQPEKFNKKDEADISDLLNEEGLADEVSVISRRYVAEIIEARVEEILAKINDELRRANRAGLLPAGVVFIGGGAKLVDLVETAKKNLRLPVSLGGNKIVPTISDKANDAEYLTALGLTAWGSQFWHENRSLGNTLSGWGTWGKKLISLIKP